MSPVYREFTRLSWRVDFYRRPKRLLPLDSRRNWHQRTHIAASAYRCTLRQLISWIQKEEMPTEEDILKHSFPRIESGKLAVGSFRPKLLALYFMRTLLETNMYAFIDLMTMSGVTLHEEPTKGVPMFEGRSPRLAWKALFLGSYACWYFRVLSAKRKGVLHLAGKRNDIGGLVLSRTTQGDQFSDNPWASGEVWFPRIDRFHESFGLGRWIREEMSRNEVCNQ